MIGLVGKPNVGKSTFFKALTLADILIANYPFATIEPNKGFGHVKIDCVDSFFKVQCNPRYGYCVNHKRFVPVEVIDVAGLVPGAFEGKGMGNQFLDNLREADVLIHVIDMSGETNEKGEPVSDGNYDPLDDIKFLENELDMWIYQIVSKGWDRFSKKIHMQHGNAIKEIAKQLSGLKITEDDVKRAVVELDLFSKDIVKYDEKDLKSLAVKLREINKPIVLVANKMDKKASKENFNRIKSLGYDLYPTMAEVELALREAAKSKIIDYIPGEKSFEIINCNNDKQKKALGYMNDLVTENNGTGIQEVLNAAVFDKLGYIAIFPGGVNKLSDSNGNVLPDCFLMPPNSKAIDFAYKLHTDFGDNFIKAINVKTKQTVGRDYLLKDLDVIEIMSNK
jgi:ribosome-binding ATPase YchF (GTP1/OBG family)